MSCAEIFQINATIVANEFIDKYMPEANGDYVKVYLYLLKNRADGVVIAQIAESLRLTEGDVRRAVKYWDEKGLISADIHVNTASSAQEAQKESGHLDVECRALPEKTPAASAVSLEEAGRARGLRDTDGLRNRYRRAEGRQILEKLGSDGEFEQLLFIVQKYRSRILTESEQEVIAYLYDGLKLPCEVIDYLVAYCVEKGHNNMRYIEKTGLDWASAGISDVKAARRRTEEFEKQASARSSKSSRSSSGRQGSRRGITRGTDLDDLVKNQVLETI